DGTGSLGRAVGLAVRSAHLFRCGKFRTSEVVADGLVVDAERRRDRAGREAGATEGKNGLLTLRSGELQPLLAEFLFPVGAPVLVAQGNPVAVVVRLADCFHGGGVADHAGADRLRSAGGADDVGLLDLGHAAAASRFQSGSSTSPGRSPVAPIRCVEPGRKVMVSPAKTWMVKSRSLWNVR